MKRNFLGFFILLSAICLFSVGEVTHAQEGSSVETFEQVPLTEASESAKLVYAQLIHAVYQESFDRDLSAAKRLYDALVQQAPDSAYIWYKRGQLRYRMQDIRGAELDTREALKLNPSHVPANWQLGRILARRAYYSGGKNVSEVLKTLKKVTELDPDHFGAHQMLADLAFQLREYSTAETSFKALTRIVPFEPEFHKRLGDIYRRTNQPQAALDAYQRVIKIKPNDLNAQKHIGHLYLTVGKLAEAQQTFKQILVVTPRDVNANLGLGLVLQEIAQRALMPENGNPQSETVEMSTLIRDAETYLGRAIFFSKEFINSSQDESQRGYYRQIAADAQYALANVYILFKNFKKAEDTFAQLLADDPEHIGATYGIASVYQTMGAFKKAETYLRKTLTIQPTHEYALNALGYLYAEQGTRLEEAEALIKRALAKSPTNGAYLDSLGWVFYKQGRFPAAITTLESANQQMPEQAEILMHLGDAYLKNGEPEKARGVWQQAQTIEPDNDEIQERLEQ